MTVAAAIAETIEQTQVWLAEIRWNASLADDTEAFRVLRAVLHQLRDRLTIEQASELGGHLPLLMRGLFFEGWAPNAASDVIRTRADFLDGVAQHLDVSSETLVRAVDTVLTLVALGSPPQGARAAIDGLTRDLRRVWPAPDCVVRRCVGACGC